MRLLVDTDAFCKLGVCDGVLERVVAAVGGSMATMAVLPTLHYMLRRGRLKKTFGEENCAKLLALSALRHEVATNNDALLDSMSGVSDIDPGEAQLFAACMESDSKLVTADKRAIRAVARLEALRAGLAGRLITMEAALLALGKEDLVELKPALQPALEFDRMLQMCFSAGNPDPSAALRSYLSNFEKEVGEGLLWLPPTESE